MESCLKRGAIMTIVTGALAIAAYMYLKNNPDIVCNMKYMAKDIAKKTYDKLDDLD